MFDDELVLIVLALLAIPLMALVALVVALGQRSRMRMLEQRILLLEAACNTLRLQQEQGFSATATPMPEASAPEASAPQTGPGPEEQPQEKTTENLPVPQAAPEPAAQFALPVPPPAPFGREDAMAPSISSASAPRPGLLERLGSFEERIGARWTVWVGGLALALGGVFLVSFAVEQNLLGPEARIGLGLLLAAILLVAGEWLRRTEKHLPAALQNEGASGTSALPEDETPLDTAPATTASIIGRSARHAMPSVPAMLTAAGTMTAFGSIYAAYELYALISPALAFVLLALTGIATVFAALLHGPALAALGFIGAALTPLLIRSDNPNAFGVAILIAAVGASALAVARGRYWRWLARLGVVGMAAWGFVLLFFAVPQAIPATGLLSLVLLGLTALLLTPGLLWGPPETGRGQDMLSTLAVALALLMSACAAVLGEMESAPLSVFILAILGALALAWRAPALALAAVAAAIIAPLPLLEWSLMPPADSALAPAGPMEGAVHGPDRYALGGFLTYGLAMAALLYVPGLLRSGMGRRGRGGLIWASAATAGPILLLLAAYVRLTTAILLFVTGYGDMAQMEPSPSFALAALVLGLLFTWSAERLVRHARSSTAAVFAAGAVVSLALALAFALEKGWLTVGLALAALGVAWVSTQRALPGLRQLSAGLGLVVLARIWWAPAIAGVDPGSTPIFNWLLWGYGVPCLAFAGAAHLLGRNGDDSSRRILECLSLLFAVLLVTFEVRHLAHGGLALDDLGSDTGLFENGLLTLLYGALALGLARLAEHNGRRLHLIFSLAVAALAAISALIGLTCLNPFALSADVGGLFINDLLIAYGLPAILALLFAGHVPTRLGPVRLAAYGLSLLLALAWLSFEVSRLFQGPVLDADSVSPTEWYAWSAIWLGFGIVLLLVGLWRHSQGLRLASALVTVATVVKVFLSDMADLEGQLRAFSFIGLGITLVAMGWLYQRLLTRSRPPSAPAQDKTAE